MKYIEKTIAIAFPAAIFIILMLLHCCDLYFPPKSFEGPFTELTPSPTFGPLPTPLPTTTPPPGGNMIYNGDFENGTDLWSWWIKPDAGDNAEASIYVENNEMVADIVLGGAQEYYVQFWQRNLSISAAQSYTLNFYARADRSKTIGVIIGEPDDPWTAYEYHQFNITDIMTLYQFVYNPGVTDDDARLLFMVGGTDDSVYIDSVSLVEN